MSDSLTLPAAYFDSGMLFSLARTCVAKGDADNLRQIVAHPVTDKWGNTFWEQILAPLLRSGDMPLWEVVKEKKAFDPLFYKARFLTYAARSGVWKMWEAAVGHLLKGEHDFAPWEEIALEAIRSGGDVAIWEDVVTRAVSQRCSLARWRWNELVGAAASCGNSAMWPAVFIKMPANFPLRWVSSALGAAKSDDLGLWEAVMTLTPEGSITGHDWAVISHMAMKSQNPAMPAAVEASRRKHQKAA